MSPLSSSPPAQTPGTNTCIMHTRTNAWTFTSRASERHRPAKEICVESARRRAWVLATRSHIRESAVFELWRKLWRTLCAHIHEPQYAKRKPSYAEAYVSQRTQAMCQNESRHTVRRVSNGVGNRLALAISEIKPRPRPLRLVQSH